MNYFVPSDKTCQKCGGFCCKLFKNIYDGGHYRSHEWGDWSEYVQFFKLITEDIQHKALYDVLLVHCEAPLIDRNKSIFNEYEQRILNYMKKIKELNIDTTYCPFHNPSTGCILTEEESLNICKQSMCDRYTEIMLHEAMKDICNCEVDESKLYSIKNVKNLKNETEYYF